MLKFIPVLVFVVLAGFLYRGLSLDPREVPSPFIGKPAPVFSGPELQQSGTVFNSEHMLGKVWVLNVWASWCRECAYEHPLFVALAKSHGLPIVGLNYKDQPNDATAWLQRFGDPYSNVVVDASGEVGIDWGVYAVPETFVVDKQGVVRYKVIGAVSAEAMQNDLVPLIEQLMEQG